MQVEITLPLIGILISIILSISSFIIARGKDSKELESRVTALETKIEPFWQFINNELPSIIAQEGTPELDVLLAKSKIEGIGLSMGECTKLITLLEIEYQKSKRQEKTGRSFAIALYLETIKQRHKIVLTGEEKC